jgi:hypothetical protein
MVLDNFFVINKGGKCVVHRTFSYGAIDAGLISGACVVLGWRAYLHFAYVASRSFWCIHAIGFASSATSFIASMGKVKDRERASKSGGGTFSLFSFDEHNFALLDAGNYTLVQNQTAFSPSLMLTVYVCLFLFARFRTSPGKMWLKW